MRANDGRRKPLLQIIVTGSYHSRHRGRVLEEDLPAKPPEGIAADAWEYVLSSQQEARDAETVADRRRALADFWEAVSHLPTVEYKPVSIPLPVISALAFGGPDYGFSDEVLREAWEVMQHKTAPGPGAEWGERHYAYWRFVRRLDPEEAYEACQAVREEERKASWYADIRHYDVRAWHNTFAHTTPHEERVRQITEAWAEVGQEPPAGALLSHPEKFG